jgi:hypothetical protein
MAKDIVNKPAAPLPVAMSDMEGDAYLGFEGMSAKDIAIPYLQVLQALSPQVKKGPSKVDGADEGDIYNSVSSKVYKGDKGIRVVPCAYQKRWVEWVDRDAGGGFVKAHETEAILDHTTKNQQGRDVLKNGNVIVTTAYHYVLLVSEDGSYERVVMSLTSTQLKKSRKWNAVMTSIQLQGKNGKFNPPSFSHSYLLHTVQETKDKLSWFGWNMEAPELIADPGLYAAAKKFNADVSGGTVKVATPDTEHTETGPATSENF